MRFPDEYTQLKALNEKLLQEKEQMINQIRFLENKVCELNQKLESEENMNEEDLKSLDRDLEKAWDRISELENEVETAKTPEEVFNFLRKINDPHANTELRNFLVQDFYSRSGNIKR
jgi:predicted nuclease with TOPRIM domain